MRRLIALTFIASCLTGCNMFLDPYELGPDGQQEADAGATDAGTTDAGATDAGATDMGPTEDMGPTADTGPTVDMATEDSGGAEDMSTSEDRLVVFDDDYSQGVNLIPFGGAVNNVQVASGEGVAGSAALRVTVPDEGYTGGTLVPSTPVDVSGFDALRFSVRATKNAVLNVTGFGITGTDVALKAELEEIDLTTGWSTYVIPLPNPAKLTSIPGLFHFAEGTENVEYDIFFDNIEYITLAEGDLNNVSATLDPFEPLIVAGGSSLPPNTNYSVSYNNARISLILAGGHLDWMTSSRSIAEVDEAGVVMANDAGRATISATLDGLFVGDYDVRVVDGPSQPAPQPSIPPANLIASIYSDSYIDVPVDTYNSPNGVAQQTTVDLQGNEVLVYTALKYAIIEMLGANTIDVTSATTFSMDIWTANGVEFRVKLVDFGADNDYLGGDDSEEEIVFNAPSGFATGQWNTLQIPITDFTDGALDSLANIAQIVIIGKSLDGNGDPVVGQSTFYVDNILFHR